MTNRREFLWHAGGGFGAVALAHLMGADSLLADTSTGKPLKPRPEFNGGLHHVARAKRVVHLFMSGAASQCDTFDLQAGTDQKERPEVRSGGQGRAVPERARGRDGQPLEMAAVRPVRPVGQRPGAAPGRLRRRHGVPAGDGREVERARAGDVHAEHRLRAPGFPQHGRLGLVRTGEPEPEPADVRGAARFARVRPQRAGQLDRRLPARRPPGNDGPARRQEPHLRPVPAR